MTEPGALAVDFEDLPSDIASLNRVAQGLLVHSEWLSAYDVDPTEFPPISRATLPVSERLGALLKSDVRALKEARAPSCRSVGTCRDFALTLCSFLRATGTPARLRCGFASYFVDGWEDHWICEYWDGKKSEWRLSDPQLDEITRAGCTVSFGPADVPREVFMTAGEAWLRCRAGKESADRFGHGDVKGLWFMRVNVVRDAYAVNDHETSAWDRRDAPSALRNVAPEELAQLDHFSLHPESPLGDIAPSWLRD
jgi:hypothetical protein